MLAGAIRGDFARAAVDAAAPHVALPDLRRGAHRLVADRRHAVAGRACHRSDARSAAPSHRAGGRRSRCRSPRCSSGCRRRRWPRRSAQPFVLATLARGVPRSRVVWRDALKASLRPVAAVYGLVVGTLLSGSFAVEVITAWPGLGRLMLDALRARDVYPGRRLRRRRLDLSRARHAAVRRGARARRSARGRVVMGLADASASSLLAVDDRRRRGRTRARAARRRRVVSRDC